MDKKIKYIKENIDNIENHNKIIDYIKKINVNYTINSNGIFINLNKIEEQYLNKIFFIIKYELDLNINLMKNNEIGNINEIKEIKKGKKYIKDIYLEELEEEEQKIILLSKKI